jgi:DNA-binding MarR family transcriptional regulator
VDDRLAAVANGLNSAAIHLIRRIRRTDAEMEISPSKASALSVLVFGGPCHLNALAAAEQVTPPSMSRTVATLQAEGFVRCETDPRDRRAMLIRATEKAVRLLERGRARRVESLARELEGLPGEDLAALARAVEVLRRLEMSGADGIVANTTSRGARPTGTGA